MSFATKILFKIFKIEELHGHNVSGKTLNKNLKAKLPLDTVRIGYIKFLVEKYYDEKECKEMLSGLASHKQDLWKSCHTAINKSILISERKSAAALVSGATSSELAASSSSNGITQLTNAIELLNESDLNKTLDDDDDDDDEDDSDDDLDDLSSGDESSEDFDLSKKIKATANKKKSITSSIKQTNIATTQRRRSDRIKKPNQKFSELDDTEDEENDDDDDDDEYKFTDENGSNVRVKEEDEVELIQNIENRQKQSIKNNQTTRTVHQKSTSTITTNSSSKQPLTIISPPPSQQQQQTPSNRTKRRNQQAKQDQESSSEASAAANIAAAMKKRFVVIATTNQKTSSN